jgi:hypothetical protein
LNGKFLFQLASNKPQPQFRQGISLHVLEYDRSLLGLGWRYSPLGLIRNKDRLLRGQVSPACKSSKSYKKKRCINLIKQELRRKPFSFARPWTNTPHPALSRPRRPRRRCEQYPTGTVAQWVL